jgi:hypothetical protein
MASLATKYGQLHCWQKMKCRQAPDTVALMAQMVNSNVILHQWLFCPYQTEVLLEVGQGKLLALAYNIMLKQEIQCLA